MVCGKKKVVDKAASKPKDQGIKFWEVLKYADRKQKMLAYVGLSCSIAAGAAMPCMALIAGNGIQVYDPESNEEERNLGVRNLVIIAGVVAIILWTASYF